MLSKRQYDEHFKLYQGYITKTKELLKTPQSTRAWKKDFNYSYSGAWLHELYFNHIDSKPSKLTKEFSKILSKHFGSYKQWLEDFEQTASACRPAGWAFLAYSLLDKKLHNIMGDSHDQFIIGMLPIITLDMYEHAYFMQWGTDKQSYIRAFIDHLDWKTIEKNYNVWSGQG